MLSSMSEPTKSLSGLLKAVDSPEGRRHVEEHLQGLPFPHYEQADSTGLLVRIDVHGQRTIGRFVNRQFKAAQKL